MLQVNENRKIMCLDAVCEARAMRAQNSKRKAIFYQRSELIDNEKALLEAVIIREDALKELAKMHRKLISESTLEPVRFVRTMIALRESSVQMVRAIVQWQQIYVRGTRQIFRYKDGSNYLLRMCEDCTVLSAFHCDAHFGFELSRNNTFCLPTQATKRPSVLITEELARLLKRVAEPDTEAVQEAWLVIRAELQHNKESMKPPLSVEDWSKKPWQLEPRAFVRADEDCTAAIAAAVSLQQRRPLIRKSPTACRQSRVPLSLQRPPRGGELPSLRTKPMAVVRTTKRRSTAFNDDDLSAITAPDEHPLMHGLLKQTNSTVRQQASTAQVGMPSTRALRQQYLDLQTSDVDEEFSTVASAFTR